MQKTRKVKKVNVWNTIFECITVGTFIFGLFLLLKAYVVLPLWIILVRLPSFYFSYFPKLNAFSQIRKVHSLFFAEFCEINSPINRSQSVIQIDAKSWSIIFLFFFGYKMCVFIWYKSDGGSDNTSISTDKDVNEPGILLSKNLVVAIQCLTNIRRTLER